MRANCLDLLVLGIVLAGLSPLKAAESKPASKPSRATAGPPKKAVVNETPPVLAAQPIPADGKKTETAIFAGGCFWCTEFAFEQVAGVVNVESGYCGGTRVTANYEAVHRGTTGHAEAIRVTYDPDKVTYDDLLDVFFDAHDPTQLNRQGKDDIGRQYRSAIFYANDDQKKQAEAKIADLNAKRVKKKIVTKLEQLTEFYLAEDYHQDFARRNPFLPYIQSHAVPKAVHVRTTHPDLIRDATPDSR